MRKNLKAFIKWKTYQEGGRKNIPQCGMRYTPLIKIKGVEMGGDWSVDFICTEIEKIMIWKLNLYFYLQMVQNIY